MNFNENVVIGIIIFTFLFVLIYSSMPNNLTGGGIDDDYELYEFDNKCSDVTYKQNHKFFQNRNKYTQQNYNNIQPCTYPGADISHAANLLNQVVFNPESPGAAVSCKNFPENSLIRSNEELNLPAPCDECFNKCYLEQDGGKKPDKKEKPKENNIFAYNASLMDGKNYGSYIFEYPMAANGCEESKKSKDCDFYNVLQFEG